MAYLYNDPASFAAEATAGFVAANRGQVRDVPGGVVRATEVPAGQVVLVIGGGSGHYPAFGGLVGRGLAHGAAIGNVFASPSAQQVYAVAKAAHRGAGVLFGYGNYTGDVLNFEQARERLLAEGIPCRTLAVTDDVSSAPPDRVEQRRGVAGDLAVFKAAAVAAEAGEPLDAVWEVARHANERTRSFGVAFTGCTLPGSADPLFTVPRGRMGVGMGIHGEPGIGERDIPTADEIAELLVDRLMAEVPPTVTTTGAPRVAVILNGLGAVKCEELFVLYRRIDELLAAANITVVEPEVGELVTSFEMAGISLTLCWLDEQLERAWRAPANTPAYRKGTMPSQEPTVPFKRSSRADDATGIADRPDRIPTASGASVAAGAGIVHALAVATIAIDAAVDELGRLDAATGDGDHGIGMQRGIRAALAAARDAAGGGAGAGTVLVQAADAWSDRAGGTSGALWGLILRAIGAAQGDRDAPDLESVTRGMRAAVDTVARHGGARRGDKTMLDVLIPFAETLAADRDRTSLARAWARSSVAADAAATATADLVPRMGRARTHADRSVGVPDPGAVSAALVLRAVSQVLNEKEV